MRYFSPHYLLYCLYGCLAVLLGACSSSRSYIVVPTPSTLDDACVIMDADDSWREAFTKTYQKYGVPPHVVMAFIHQESRFVRDARAPTSTAYGYPQALDETWDWYKGKSGNRRARRDDFSDAVDFIGWYLRENHRRTRVSKWDAGTQYLAYHDGTGGYLRGTHIPKQWLLEIADKVDNRAIMYRSQLARCFQYPSS